MVEVRPSDEGEGDLVHGPDEADGEDGEDEAGHQLEEDAVEPHGEGEDQLAVQPAVGDLQAVEGVAGAGAEEGAGVPRLPQLQRGAHRHQEHVGHRQEEGHHCGQTNVTASYPRKRGALTVSEREDDLAPGDGAERDGLGGELDHDEPPDGEGEGQPDGHRVDHHAEVAVEEHEDAPGQGVLARGGQEDE